MICGDPSIFKLPSHSNCRGYGGVFSSMFYRLSVQIFAVFFGDPRLTLQTPPRAIRRVDLS